MSQYMNSNPLAEHNAGIALSSKQIPVGGGGTGNMYQGQGGRAFVQGGGGGSRRRSSKRKLRKTGRRNKKRGCDIVTGFGGSRRYRRCRCCKSSCRRSRKQRSQRKSQSGGGWGAPYGSSAASGINAGYSIGGPGTGVTASTIALANPAAPTAYNSCHPV